jgi:hypothetical protein
MFHRSFLSGGDGGAIMHPAGSINGCMPGEVRKSEAW